MINATFGQIMSIATPVICCADFDQVMELASAIVNEEVWLHDMGRVAREIRPMLIEQFAWMPETITFINDLAERLEGTVNQANDFFNAMELYRIQQEIPQLIQVHPIAQEDHVSLPPDVSLAMVAPYLKTITIDSNTGQIIEADED
jgi:hypothetical protein